MAAHDRGTGRTIESVETALELIHTIRDKNGASLTDLTSDLEYSKSTIHYYLKTLRESGYLINEGNTFDIGLRFLTLGGYAISRSALLDVIDGEVHELADRTGSLAVLAVEEAGSAIVIYRYPPSKPAMDIQLGAIRPLHCTGTGKAILASLPSERIQDIVTEHGLPSFTEQTITAEGPLKEELAAIRDDGFAFDDREYLPQQRSIAAPIGKVGTETVDGAVGIVASSSDIEDPRTHLKEQRFTEKPVDQVMRTAQVVGSRLGDR